MNGPNQQWTVNRQGDGSYYLLSVNSGEALGVENGSANDGAGVKLYDDDGSCAQQWKFIAVGGAGTAQPTPAPVP